MNNKVSKQFVHFKKSGSSGGFVGSMLKEMVATFCKTSFDNVKYEI
jgi:hypothetical protein